MYRYSPDENPIEAGFHIWKTRVRRDFHGVANKSKANLVRVMEESLRDVDMVPHFIEAGFHSVESRVARDARVASERVAMLKVAAAQGLATLASLAALAYVSL